MKYPQWKKRQIKAKAEAEAAERKARYDAFWNAVEKLKRPRVKPIDYSELGVIE